MGALVCLAASVFVLFLGNGPLSTLTLESVPVELRGSAMAGSIFVIHLLGDLWSPTIVGATADHLDGATGTPAALQRALLILPAALCVCAALWAWLAARQRQAPATLNGAPVTLSNAG